MNAFLKILVVGALIHAPVTATAAEKLIAKGPEYTVEYDAARACGLYTALTIRSDNYAFFSEHSQKMQNALDAARAMLEFHCSRIDKIEVTGELRGLDGPVYRGRAASDSDWVLVADQSIKEANDVGLGQSSLHPNTNAKFPGYSVANLRVGMSVGEAQASIHKTFGAWPSYDPKRQVMTLSLNGCPSEYEAGSGQETPGPDWKCLKVWFGDREATTLKGLHLVQVIDEGDVDSVEAALRARFGQPAERTISTRENESSGSGKTIKLSWGTQLNRNTRNYQLVADLIQTGNMIVADLKLNESDSKGSLGTRGRSLAGLVL